ncbi:protein tyrosine phosphatase [Caballeronia udeis]|uniref:Protein tyrosine phosphatase n=1 Tax=Caballeronia udeis TaxID=1232866 RepID=A0A158FJX4_9BURK|nr:arsenate reductase ArsC [Caballeronia udeis]SAL19963.1 protein tyrosine phosphatase [Caballeronia udeis]
MNAKCKVLFLCRANSARSIMAESLLRQLAPDRFEAFSAGVEPAARVHPLTIAQLSSTIADIHLLQPKSWQRFVDADAPRMDVIVAMCDEADEAHAPNFPGSPVFCRWTFDDPLAEFATEDLQKQAFERVFRQILRRISVFIALPLQSMNADEQVLAVNAHQEADRSGADSAS